MCRYIFNGGKISLFDKKKKYKIRNTNPYKRRRRQMVLAAAGIILVVAVVGCAWWLQLGTEESQTEVIPSGDLLVEKQGTVSSEGDVTEENEEAGIAETIDVEAEVNQEAVANEVAEYLASMNTETKVSQLLWVTPEELMDFSLVVQAGETTKSRLTEYPVGGIVYTSQNFEVPDQMELMLNNTKLYTRFPIFLAMDEDGLLPINNLGMQSTELGFNVEIIDGTFYLVQGDLRKEMSGDISIIIYEEEFDAVDCINNGGDILFVQDGFEDVYNELLEAVRSEEITEATLDERITNTLTYKVANGI